MKKISLLGSTGSIGTSTLDVVRKNSDQLEIVALSCGKNIELLAEQIKEFKPKLVSLAHEEDLIKLRKILAPIGLNPEIVYGRKGNVDVATVDECDFVLSAIVGAEGLLPTYEAILAGKDIGLANKETLVVAGPLMKEAVKKSQVQFLPVDSEHSAIFQCLVGERRDTLRKVIVTASGGPFFAKPKEEFAHITLQEALKHPNWTMGAKITIDSASMMNKGLELIEAKYLFDLSDDELEVLVHPQSIIHSLVEFHDGSVMAQLGIPDMRVPIAYALTYPTRAQNDLPSLNLAEMGQLTFFPPDYEKFPCLELAWQCLREGKAMPAVLNAANEIAVASFLEERIRFTDLAKIIASVLEQFQNRMPESIEDCIEIDTWARNTARSALAKL